MHWRDQLDLFSLADLAAVAGLVAAWWLMGWFTDHPPRWRASVSVLMADYRRQWMRQLVTRTPRIFDSAVMDSLRAGATFFASTSMIAIGGVLALIGNPETLLGVARELTAETPTAIVWQVKLMIVLLFMINAFLKFVWAHRLFGYCLVVMASVPNDPSDPDAYPRAAQAAEINISASRSFNKGLNAVYFALGSLAFLISPQALATATVVTLVLMIRREFGSQSREVLLRGVSGGG
jgi:uncharacterized membrane protein